MAMYQCPVRPAEEHRRRSRRKAAAAAGGVSIIHHYYSSLPNSAYTCTLFRAVVVALLLALNQFVAGGQMCSENSSNSVRFEKCLMGWT